MASSADTPPPAAYYHSILGLQYEIGREDASALQEYETALRHDPKARFLLHRIAIMLHRTGRDQEALEYAQRTLQNDPEDVETLFLAGDLAIAAGQPDQAIDLYERLIRADPHEVGAYARLAGAYTTQNRQDAAEAVLLRGIAANPASALAHHHLGSVYAEAEQWEKAVAQYQTALTLDPAFDPAALHMGIAYERQGKDQEAADVYAKLLARNPGAYDLRLRLGALYLYKLKNPLEAVAQTERAHQSDPARWEDALLSGLALYELGRYEEAARAFSEGIGKRPDNPDLYFHLGTTYDKLKRPDDLVAAMERAIQIDPRHVNALNYLGYTYADAGVQLDKAIELVNRALVLEPGNGAFMDSLGWAYYKKNALSEAVQYLEKAAALAPDDPVIHEHLGEVYLRQQRPAQARAAWAESLKLDPANEKLRLKFKEAGFGQDL